MSVAQCSTLLPRVKQRCPLPSPQGRGGSIQRGPAGRDAIEQTIKDELIKRFRDGVRVGLSDTTSHGNRPGEQKARLLLEVLRDREPDVLRFAHDLKVPPTSNQAERDLRPAKVQQNISGRLTSEKRTKDRYRIRG
jgi:transposase